MSTGRRPRELHRRVDRLGAAAREEHGVEAARQALRQLLGEHAGQHRIVDLDAVDEVRGERRLQHLADVGVVVAEAREPLAGVHVEVRATVGVVEVRALGRDVLSSNPRIPRTSTSDGSRCRAASVRVSGARDSASLRIPRESRSTRGVAMGSRVGSMRRARLARRCQRCAKGGFRYAGSRASARRTVWRVMPVRPGITSKALSVGGPEARARARAPRPARRRSACRRRRRRDRRRRATGTPRPRFRE